MVTVYGLQTLEKNTPFVYGNNNALMEISSAHNFGACTNVSCLMFDMKNDNHSYRYSLGVLERRV